MGRLRRIGRGGAAAVAAVFPVSVPAYAVTSSTTGGYAYTTGAYKVSACDTTDDGHEIEGQSKHSSGPTQFVRDSASTAGCTSNTYGRSVTQIRACKLMLRDDCDIWRRR